MGQMGGGEEEKMREGRGWKEGKEGKEEGGWQREVGDAGGGRKERREKGANK